MPGYTFLNPTTVFYVAMLIFKFCVLLLGCRYRLYYTVNTIQKLTKVDESCLARRCNSPQLLRGSFHSLLFCCFSSDS